MKNKDWSIIIVNALILIIFALVGYSYSRDINNLEKEVEKKVDKEIFEYIKQDITEIKKDVKELLKSRHD